MQNVYKEPREAGLLAFGAHPDDIEFANSAAIITYKDSSYQRVGIVDMSLGELATNGTVRQRLGEARIAAQILNADFRVNLEVPNNGFRYLPELRDSIIKLIRVCTPRIILIPFPVDRHPDHENTNKILRMALFESGLAKRPTFKSRLKRYQFLAKRVLSKSLLSNFIDYAPPPGDHEPYRPDQVYESMMWTNFNPTVVVAYGQGVMDKRMKAIFTYQSQFNPTDNRLETIDTDPRLKGVIEGRARDLGLLTHKEFGEGYRPLDGRPAVVSCFTQLDKNFF